MSQSESSSPANTDSLVAAPVSNDQGQIIEQIQRTLACLGYAQLNKVRCSASGDEITLTGQLDSFYLKQVAQSVAIKVPGVRNVRNDIQVV